MSRRGLHLAAAIASLLVAACASKSEAWNAREVPQLAVSEHFRSVPAESAPALERGDVDAGWIAGFGDERLSALVAEALEHNSDLELAGSRADLARALAKRAGADLTPVAAAFANLGRGDSGEGEATRIELGLQASWEPDVWGRLSKTQRAAELDAEAARADLVGARHSLAAATARAWFLAIAARQRVQVDERSLVQRERVERITRAHYDAGEQPGGDVDVAAGQTDGARALAQQSRGALRSALLSLETLLGRYPSGELDAASALPAALAPPPLGLPSQLLERRPDVVAAERSVAAAYERLAAADAARLPRIALTAEGGFSNDELKHLTDPSNVIWDLAAGLLAPLYAGGRFQADVDAARAIRRGALATYLGVARNAFFEVENALTSEATLRERETSLTSAVDHLRRARELSEERYVQGEATILELDQVHTQLYQSERDLLATRVDLLLQRVALHLALGGSFEAQP
ncbi:MAG TPA: efflux transporter outer membrane subunit [Planctomycetota bacterium]|nr:efflux transporter outer membrane subunit [Planctomycetota bacterium]